MSNNFFILLRCNNSRCCKCTETTSYCMFMSNTFHICFVL